MKSLFLLGVAVCVTLCVYAQPRIDSLKNLTTKAHDTDSILYFTAAIAYDFFINNQYDSALRYYYKSLTIKTKSYKPAHMAYVYNGMGGAYSKLGRPDSSLNYYFNALKLFHELKDTTHIIIVETNISGIYKNIGLFDKALDYSFNALTRLEELPPDRSLASCYSTIGFVYSAMRDYPKALEYHTKALKVRKKIAYKRGIGQSYTNIGEVYRDIQLYDSALVNLFRSIEIKRQLEEHTTLPSPLNLTGDVYISQNNLVKAEPYLTEALTIRRKSNDRSGLVVNLNSLGLLYTLKKDYKRAQQFLVEAETMAHDVKSPELLSKTIQLRLELARKTRDYASSLRYADELFTLKDSLLNSEKLNNLQAAEIKYETEKKEQQILLLEQKDKLSQAEISAKQTLIIALFIGVGLMVIIALLIYKNLQTARKGRQKNEMLLKEMHHRIKNNLQMLSSVFSLQSQSLTDENAIQAVKRSESRVNAMALIHRKLYSGEENTSINIKEYITELIQFLVSTYGYGEEHLRLDLDIEEISVDVDKAIPLGLIINELVTNAFKYAYTGQKDPVLNVILKQIKNGELAVIIGDNGHGIEKNMQGNEEKKFGIKMVDALIRDLRGKYQVHSESGKTVYSLNIPLAQWKK